MSERKEYTADDLNILEFDESIYDSVDLSRESFTKNLQDAAISARDFTRTLVTNMLPDAIEYTILYGCSYDGNPLVEDEKTYPEDNEHEPLTIVSVDEVTRLLWRDGFIPEWINVIVSHVNEDRTNVKLECCGRYSAMPRMMYHIQEGRPPFHVLGPPMPPEFGLGKRDGKFDLHYWRKDA